MKLAISTGVLLAAVALVACGAGEESSSGATDRSTSDQPPGPAHKMSRAEKQALPQFTIRARHGQPPRNLVVRDLRKGTGAVLKPNDYLVVYFAGIPYGEALTTTPATRNRAERLRLDGVIEGWEKGLPGMKVGGRRELIVPSRMGDAGTTMIYQVDLLAAGLYRSPSPES